jgi:hypothetical protein
MEEQKIIELIEHLKTVTQKRTESIIETKKKFNFISDLTTLVYKYDFLSWEEVEQIITLSTDIVQKCNEVIYISQKIMNTQPPFQPWGEIIPDQLEDILKNCEDMKNALISLKEESNKFQSIL